MGRWYGLIFHGPLVKVTQGQWKKCTTMPHEIAPGKYTWTWELKTKLTIVKDEAWIRTEARHRKCSRLRRWFPRGRWNWLQPPCCLWCSSTGSMKAILYPYTSLSDAQRNSSVSFLVQDLRQITNFGFWTSQTVSKSFEQGNCTVEPTLKIWCNTETETRGCCEVLELVRVLFWAALYDGMGIGSHCVHVSTFQSNVPTIWSRTLGLYFLNFLWSKIVST